MLDALIGVDQQLFLFINRLPHPFFLVFLAQVLSGTQILGLVWLVIGVGLIYFERHHPKLLLDLILALVSASFLAQGVIKQIFLRLRPEFLLKDIVVYEKVDDYLSFPSGHAATAFAGAYILSKIFPKGKVALFSLAALVAFSRIYLGVHYPSDIIAGIILGLAVSIIIEKITKISSRKK